MQSQVLPPFQGPVPGRTPNPLATASTLSAVALASLGIGLGVSGYRKMRNHGRLICSTEEVEDGHMVPLVGVLSDYEGDWWEQRGRRLYWKARRSGAQAATQIATGIIAADIGADAQCMTQFPTHAGTYERNAGFWHSLIEHVQREMSAE